MLQSEKLGAVTGGIDLESVLGGLGGGIGDLGGLGGGLGGPGGSLNP